MFASVIFELETGAAVAHACLADVGPALGALPSAAQPCVACGISHVDSMTISPMLAALTLFESGAAHGTDSDATQLVPSSPRARAAMSSTGCRRLAGDSFLFSDRAGSAILMRPLFDATWAGAPIAEAGAIRASATAPGLSSAQLMVRVLSSSLSLRVSVAPLCFPQTASTPSVVHFPSRRLCRSLASLAPT